MEKERYALPLAAVREVFLPPGMWARVPSAPPAIRGIIHLRGRVVTVVDLRRLMGIQESVASSEKIMLLDRGRRDLGLLVTEVEGIEPIEKIAPEPGRPTLGVKGVAKLKRSAITVLDPDGIDRAVASLFTSKVKSS
jgi:purine-binding chemotaxis protein CheW